MRTGERSTTLAPVAVVFILFGVYWGAWAVATADIERSLRISHGGFGLLLSAALLGAAGLNAIAGPLAERWGTGPALRASLALWGAFLVGGAVAQPRVAFALLMIAVVTAGGAVDVVMNVAAMAALTERPGHLVRFHGLFNAGAAVGAVACGVLLHSGATWRWVWAATGLIALAIAAGTARVRLPAGEAGTAHSLAEGLRALRAERLVLLSLAFAAGAMIEGAVGTWGVLYLRDQLASGLLVGTAAAAGGYGISAVARFTLGPLAGSAGAGRGVAAGAALAAVGLGALALLHAPALAALGLVAANMGISLCWPLLLAEASARSRGGTRPGVVVGGFSAVGYLGLVLGPGFVGALASAAGLRAALLVLTVIAAVVAVSPTRSVS